MGHDQQLQVFQPAPPGTRKVRPIWPYTFACALCFYALLLARNIPVLQYRVMVLHVAMYVLVSTLVENKMIEDSC